MKKEDIFVRINNKEQAKQVVDILEKAGQDIYDKRGMLAWADGYPGISFDEFDEYWVESTTFPSMKDISIEELNQFLNPNQRVKDGGDWVSLAKEIVTTANNETHTKEGLYHSVMAKLAEYSQPLKDIDS